MIFKYVHSPIVSEDLGGLNMSQAGAFEALQNLSRAMTSNKHNMFAWHPDLDAVGHALEL